MKRAMLKRIFIFLFIICCVWITGYSQDYIDSLETKLILVDNDQKLLILDELIPYYFRNEPAKANKEIEKMLSYARQQGNKKYEVKAQRYKGLSDSRIRSYHEDALKECYEVQKNAKANGLFEEVILTKLAIADIYHQIGINAKSLDYQLEAFHIADSMHYSQLYSVILISQARTYILLDDYEKAEQCLKSALKNAKILDQQEIVAESNIVFGDLYFSRFNQSLALEHYLEAQQIYARLRKDMMVAIAFFKIGECYFSMEQLQTAFQNHLQALDIRKRIKDGTGLAESFNKIGLLFIENGEYQRAIKNLQLGLSYAEKSNSNILMQQSFDYLRQAYLGIDDYKNALDFQNKFIEISELIYSEADERRVEETNNKNEIDKRNLEIQNLKITTEQKEKELAASQKNNFLLGLILIITLGAALFIVWLYRGKRKYAKELQLSNDQKMKQNNELIELNSTKDKFFSIIGHDLKGPLNSLTAFSHLLINHTASLTEEEIRTIAKDLDKSLKNLYELLDNLLGWARSQTGKIDYIPKKINVPDLIRENVQLLAKAAMNKKIRIEVLIDEEVEAFADANSVNTVIRNLLSNAIKFTNTDGIITIFVDQWKDHIELGISDTGVGMSKEDQEKIFDISSKHSTLGTNKEKGTGLGLILCKEFVERNHGRISIESEVGIGTTFKFTLPKSTESKPTPVSEAN